MADPDFEQPTAPYLDAVVAYGFRGPGRFHVPGHKGGPGADRFFGGGGNDVIDSRDGLMEHVYCGFGDHDVVRADLRDIVNSDCEKVVRAPAQARAPR